MFLTRDGRVFESGSVEHGSERDSCNVRLHHTCIQTRNIEEGIEQLLHRIDRPAHIADHLALTRRKRRLLKRLNEQPERMQRLPQVMACRSQETRFGDVGVLGRILLLAQLADQPEVFEPQLDGLVDQAVHAQKELIRQPVRYVERQGADTQ